MTKGLVFATLFLLFCPALRAQNAELSGLVKDPSDANVPGALIKITNVDTAQERQTETNNEGFYTLPSLPPGKYEVQVSKSGFQTLIRSNLTLEVAQRARLDFTLQVGSSAQTVTVTAEGPYLNTTDGSVSTVVDRQFVGNLPLNGRTFQTLIGLAPGAVLASTGFDDGQFSVNGQRANANYFMVDGVSANIAVNPGFNPGQAFSGSTPGVSALGTTSNLVSIDAMQEFKILTSTFAPEFGRTPGAQVLIATRSGTNEFHGNLFDYFRNEALDANDWFANSLRQKKPPLRQNDFGGVFSGPVRLPGYNGHDKTFFFFSYEGLRLRLPQTLLSQVPSLNARQIAPAAVQPFLKAYPLPNGRDLANNISEFSASFSNPFSLDSTGIRVDHTIGNRGSVFGRYNYAPSDKMDRAGGTAPLSGVAKTSLNTQTITGGATLSFGPTISNDFRINYSRNSGAVATFADNFGGAVPPPDSILFPQPFSSQNSVFTFNLSGLTSGAFSVGQAGLQVQRQINVVNTTSLQTGPHQFKFGVDYRRLFPVNDPFHLNLNIVVSGVTGALTGKAASAFIQVTSGLPLYPVFTNLSLFAQDTWKIRHRLTLTYGLRWDVNPAPKEKNGRDPLALANVENPAAISFAPVGTPLYKTRYNNFAPRTGIAYQLSQVQKWQTVVRGGFGIFYDLGSSQSGGQFGFNFPNAALKVVNAPPIPLDAASAAPPTISLNPPFPGTLNGAMDPNLKLPYTYQWNAALEQSLGLNQILTASYVSAVGRRLLREEFIPSSPTFPSVLLTRNGATSDYHALQLEYQRRLSKGLQALGSYTWSHSLDNVSTDASQTEAPITKINLDQERGSSTFDVRHSFSLAVTYDIPKIAEGAVAKAVLSTWSVYSIFRTRSALPVNVVTGRDVFGIGFNGTVASRPNLIPGVPFYLNDPTAPGGRRLNDTAPTAAQIAAAGCAPVTATTPAKGAFCTPATLQQGNLGRNALRGFGMWQLDFGVRRQFGLTERLKLQFTAEAFNIFNHPNFADPGMGGTFSGTHVLRNAQFGLSTSMLAKIPTLGQGLNPLYQVGGPRSLQLALKLVF